MNLVLLDAPVWIWTLRVVVGVNLIWLIASTGRSIRFNRAAQFQLRPSAAQGLAGRYTPTVSLLLLAPTGVVEPWASRIAYPRLQVVVAVPPEVKVRGPKPRRAVAVRSASDRPSDMLEAATRASAGEVLVVVPPGYACGPGFVKRLVAPLVDPFAGAAVPRTETARPGRGLAALIDHLERTARRTVNVGAHCVGGPVVPDGEPFAVRSLLVQEVGGWDPDQPAPSTDLVLRIYARGFLVPYVENAVALAEFGNWSWVGAGMAERIRGRRRLWRIIRKPVRKGKVLEGPEKTDVRWSTRGATAPFWLATAWLSVAVLRVADTSWAPEALGGALVLLTLTTPLVMVPFVAVTTAALQTGRWRTLALVPWLPLLMLGTIWTGSGASVRSALRRRGRRREREETAPRPLERGAAPTPENSRPPRSQARETKR